MFIVSNNNGKLILLAYACLLAEALMRDATPQPPEEKFWNMFSWGFDVCRVKIFHKFPKEWFLNLII